MPLAFVWVLGGLNSGWCLGGKHFVDGAISTTQSCLFSHLVTSPFHPWLVLQILVWFLGCNGILSWWVDLSDHWGADVLCHHGDLQELDALLQHRESILCHPAELWYWNSKDPLCSTVSCWSISLSQSLSIESVWVGAGRLCALSSHRDSAMAALLGKACSWPVSIHGRLCVYTWKAVCLHMEGCVHMWKAVCLPSLELAFGLNSMIPVDWALPYWPQPLRS